MTDRLLERFSLVLRDFHVGRSIAQGSETRPSSFDVRSGFAPRSITSHSWWDVVCCQRKPFIRSVAFAAQSSYLNYLLSNNYDTLSEPGHFKE